MAHVQFMDEIIREYLLFRGFGSTVKAFDSDLKGDKEKSFRVDKIIDQIIQYITNYDLNSLRELWNHLNNYMFSKLESHFTPGVKKLENAILKMYLINTVVNNKPDKIMEFFMKLTPELQNQVEWKDWFESVLLEEVTINIWRQMWYLHDDATVHNTAPVNNTVSIRDLLNTKFQNRWTL